MKVSEKWKKDDNEILRWMANCIRRHCNEQVECRSCCFVSENGNCDLCHIPLNWTGYEEKTEFAISTVAKYATTTCESIAECTEEEVNCVECSSVAKNATVQKRIELVEE